ncbi:unnamed protein product [marine sediment metagenome]|uniref:Uncharacterized protein n=1 Tax=marine sediment metagenome TaxID=412755 RepID=X1KSP4_9ZZZZ
MPTLQWARYPWDVKIIAYRCDPVFYMPSGKRYTDLEVHHIEGGFGDILKACELGKLNVLYFEFGKNEQTLWAKFSKFLVQRNIGEYASNFVSLFVDEASEIIPSPGFGPFRNVKSLGESRNYIAHLSLFVQHGETVRDGSVIKEHLSHGILAQIALGVDYLGGVLRYALWDG